jgi:integrase/recombinase XerC
MMSGGTTSITRNSRTTIQEAVLRFRDYLQASKLAPKTVSDYFADVTSWRKWLAENSIIETVEQLARDDVTDYLFFLGSQTARPHSDTQTGLAAATIKRRLAALRSFAAFLVQFGLSPSNIATGVRSPRSSPKEPSFLGQQEYKALLYEAQRRHKPRDYAILVTFLQTGIRVGELCHLTLTDLLLDRRELLVRRRKGGVDTDIPLNSVAVDALRGWLSVRPTALADNLFLSKNSRPLTERAIRYLVKSYLRRAGIRKQASVHTLRHTFGSHKANKGVDIAQLQYWMGHKRRETTLTYIHLIKKRAPELMEATAL